jgi:integrase
MGRTKYPVMDPDFSLKMLGACRNDEERAIVTILHLSGMHISSLCDLKRESLLREGKGWSLEWIRPKTKKTLRVTVPPEKVELVQKFLEIRRKSPQWYNVVVKEIGRIAGYDGIAPMTFRHGKCIELILSGEPILFIPQRLGCTLDVVVRNYAMLKESGMLEAKKGAPIS